MRFNGPLRNCQSKTCATCISGASFIDSIESIEYTGRLVFGYSWSLVLDSQLDKLRLVGGVLPIRQDQTDGAPGGRVLDGIVEKIDHGHAEETAVRKYGNPIVANDRNRLFLVFSKYAHNSDGFLYQVHHGKGGPLQLYRA